MPPAVRFPLRAILLPVLALCAGLLSAPAPAVAGGAAQDPPLPDSAPGDTLAGPAQDTVLPPPEDIAPSRAELDEEIRSDLQATFDRVEALKNVEVQVEAGIVRLQGTVPVAGTRARADSLARRLDGVIVVEDRLEVDRSLQRRWAATWDQLREWLLDAVGYLPLLLAALTIVLVTMVLQRAAGAWLEGRFTGGENPYVRSLIRRAIRLFILGAGLLVALNLVGATWIFGALVGTAGLAGLAIGFAFKDIIENYLAGILLSIRHPFSPNDFVSVADREGKIVRLTARETILMTLDGNHVRIPNAMVFGSVIVNFSRNPLRRFGFDIGVGTGEDLAEVQDVGMRTLEDMKNVLDDPPPLVLVKEMGDSSVVMGFFGWFDQRTTHPDVVRSEAIRLVKGALDTAGIEMPSPEHRVVWVGEGGAPGERRASEGSRPPPRPTAPERPADPDHTLDRQIARDREVERGDLLTPPPQPGNPA